ncbi:hypothetical protein, partial [Microvirga aerophila]|uniref:hypothetical protein n=1 Tax=Microvirga aerophila TaxID=670291 RepID=UPI001AEE811C
FVESRYAVACPDAAAVIAAKLQGGSMLNLLSESCAGRFGTSILLLSSTGIVLLPSSSVK